MTRLREDNICAARLKPRPFKAKSYQDFSRQILNGFAAEEID
jgi:hypothetical protein